MNELNYKYGNQKGSLFGMSLSKSRDGLPSQADAAQESLARIRMSFSWLHAKDLITQYEKFFTDVFYIVYMLSSPYTKNILKDCSCTLCNPNEINN